ncbi:hypothetical protein [Micrococcus luteus]|uniref:hypothetical protein n=1 Tax=Micrococcus luteus TaxID=1270 RepID=UPI00301A3D0D
MTVHIYSEDLPFDATHMRRAHEEWAKFPKRIVGNLPKRAKKFLGRRPGEELGDNEFSDTHVEFALLMALTGQRGALVPLFRGDLCFEESVKPYRDIRAEHRRVVNRWCAQRVGLTGWAEVFAVPAGPEPAPEEDIPRVDYYVSSPVSWREPENVKWWGTPGEPDGLRWRKASSFVPFFRQVLDRLGWLIVARATPWMNAHGWSDEFLDAEIEWCARMVRGRLGLALEQPVLVSDPRVELPPEFSGFVTG